MYPLRYISVDSKILPLYSIDALQKMAVNGIITPDRPIYNAALMRWIPAKQWSELKPFFYSNPANYIKIKTLGGGGFGHVNLMRFVPTRREYAVKFLLRGFDPTCYQRFKLEAEKMYGFNHPNIVRVIWYNLALPKPFYVMEYHAGQSLRHQMNQLRLQQKVFHPQWALNIILSILKALSYAHARGVFHRDVKPENVLITTNGTVKLLDFGIARFADHRTMVMTRGGIGTPGYWAPEQMQGLSIDVRADIYSVGVVLYEMLMGHLPSSTLQTTPAPSVRWNNIPKVLDEVIVGMIHPDRNRRYSAAVQALNVISWVCMNYYRESA